MNWPPLSFNLMPFDHFLWEAMRAKCMQIILKKIQDLKAAIADIKREIVENVLKNSIDRMDNCQLKVFKGPLCDIADKLIRVDGICWLALRLSSTIQLVAFFWQLATLSW